MNPDRCADFGRFGGRVWLNCAHQGPLPRVAVSAAYEAIRLKARPYLIRDDDFVALPKSLKQSIARLIGSAEEDIILGNSASYGIHLLRNGIQWRSGDEILLVQGDFPATIYPWLGLQERGVRVRTLEPRGLSLAPDEVASSLTPSTRLLCASWVNSFNGSVLDVRGIGQLCKTHQIIFVVNGSQGVGALQINVRAEPIDALVSCGYKWLCGPYATGFCWITPELRNQLTPSQTYWLPHVWGQENLTDYRLKRDLGSASFDIFCTANFLNFMPWRASIDYLLSIGIAGIEEHNRATVDRLASAIDKKKYRIISPSDRARRSAIVVLSHVEQNRNGDLHAALAASGIDIAIRNGNLRLSPHIHNASTDIERAVSTLNSFS